MAKVKKQRPINLDIKTIHFPITAIFSILHRITGVINVFTFGFLMLLLDKSLSSPESFIKISVFMSNFFVKGVLWSLLTALIYHAIGGIRHMLMDFGYLEETLLMGKISANIVFIVTFIFSIIVGIIIW
ncbi:succinate dehydrogenase, cytochrome b556 subunit [Candidatus Ishikawella capsulata]|uniref:Succinate dehydrogenase cytochrome b556 subunit n=1 Tax=Candidatus Ishikawaella capsulata Mpkobe TaxID=476281 RepID=C5WDD4_9ENTR|nr:succinate dehydrogenase, cytochrome b556 subunit [Candidatus Ishikawaella capsulata]BAH83340.1 succinate dehydrogenase cytochrome b556 large membrane subunit [Candidatus Ishikawaella capsulata Mpkobe]